jgi:hypothetical protein
LLDVRESDLGSQSTDTIKLNFIPCVLALSLRDLRRVAIALIPWTPEGWEVHMYGRLAALPDQAEPIQRARLLAALSVGNQLIELRGAASWLGVEEEFSSALRSFAAGRGAITASKSVPQTGHGVDAA